MSTPPKPYTFIEDTDIISDEVNADFDAVFDWIANEAIHADASKPFSSIPSGPNQDPATDNQLARKKYVDDKITSNVAGAVKCVGYKASSSTASIGTAIFPISGTAITYTFDASRLYKFEGIANFGFASPNMGIVLAVMEGSTERFRLAQDNNAQTLGRSVGGWFTAGGISGTRTFQMGSRTVTGPASINGNSQPALFTIYDLGPIPA